MRLRSLATVGVVLCALSCATADNPAAPTSAMHAQYAAIHAQLAAPITIVPLQRLTPLSQPITKSAYIGVLGGILSVPAAGLTVVVPPLALTSTRLISVTALPGTSVAYEFSPHGTQFLVPVIATQSLRNTAAQTGGLIDPSSLFVGYFPDGSNILSVTELLDISVDVLDQVGVFDISHFSGYILASGSDGDVSGS